MNVSFFLFVTYLLLIVISIVVKKCTKATKNIVFSQVDSGPGTPKYYEVLRSTTKYYDVLPVPKFI